MSHGLQRAGVCVEPWIPVIQLWSLVVEYLAVSGHDGTARPLVSTLSLPSSLCAVKTIAGRAVSGYANADYPWARSLFHNPYRHLQILPLLRWCQANECW